MPSIVSVGTGIGPTTPTLSLRSFSTSLSIWTFLPDADASSAGFSSAGFSSAAAAPSGAGSPAAFSPIWPKLPPPAVARIVRPSTSTDEMTIFSLKTVPMSRSTSRRPSSTHFSATS